jgi:hypothetical protein
MKRIIIAIILIILNMAGMTPVCLGGAPTVIGFILFYFGIVSVLKKSEIKNNN